MKKILIIALNIGYWALLAILLSIVYSATQINAPNDSYFYKFLSITLKFIIIPSFIAFYTSYFFLFHLFIKKGKRLKLFILLVIFLLTSTSIAILNVYPIVESSKVLLEVGVVSFLLNGFNIIVAFILRSFISWFKDLKEKEALNKKTVALELMILKLKLDPHFLFNTINNIDVLIENDPKKASEYIIKLSSILRFYLYKTSEALIPLADEIKYIEEYVALQKIRTSNKHFVKLSVEGSTKKKEIAPMLFISFIENAFKHSINKKNEDSIEIKFTILDNEIHFQCKNKIEIYKNNEAIGIGNKLIENRLALLYSGNYQLIKNISDNEYMIDLKISV